MVENAGLSALGVSGNVCLTSPSTVEGVELSVTAVTVML